MEEMSYLKLDMIIWIDETGSDYRQSVPIDEMVSDHRQSVPILFWTMPQFITFKRVHRLISGCGAITYTLFTTIQPRF